MTVKTSISLHDDLAAFARAEVDSGRSVSLSGVIHEGLLELRARREREAREKAEEEAFLAMLKRRAEGPFVSHEEMNRRVAAMIARKRREHGLEN